MTVIPRVVSLLITGVASANDVKAIGRLGGRTLVVFLSLLVGVAMVAIPLIPSLFALLPTSGAKPPLPAGAVEAAGQIVSGGPGQTFGGWLTSLIPSNPIAAAANGQMVSLIIFTILLALAIARSPEQTRTPLLGFFQALGDTMLILVHWVILAAPLGIFAMVLPLAAHAGAALAGAIGFYIAAYSDLMPRRSCCCSTRWSRSSPGFRSGTSRGRHLVAAHRVQLGVEHRVATGTRRAESADLVSRRGSPGSCCRSRSRHSSSRHRSVDSRRAVHRWFYGVPLHARELATIAFAAVFLGFAVMACRAARSSCLAAVMEIGLPAEGDPDTHRR
jgi:hypothetical protein